MEHPEVEMLDEELRRMKLIEVRSPPESKTKLCTAAPVGAQGVQAR